MKKYALLDFDGTLYNGFCINDFIKFLARKPSDSWALEEEKEIIKKYVAGEIDYKEGSIRIFNTISTLLKGRDFEDVLNEARSMFNKNNKIYDWVFPVVKMLKEMNFEVFIISASIKPLVSVAAEKLEINNIVTSELGHFKGKFDGRVELILDNLQKEKVIKKLFKNWDNKRFVIAFGDSTGDVKMLSLADASFVVNYHQEEMVELSKTNGWHLLDKNDVYDDLKKLLDNHQGK